jgi:predicted nucleotidyltransferase component of viral defense system
MIIPLEKRLKKRMHVEIALLQDEAMEVLYGIDRELVLHGGTSVWRCYGGNRFSEDLDLYAADIADIWKQLQTKLLQRSLQILKFKKTQNLVFCKVSNGSAEIRIEINHSAKRKAAQARQYEKTDGTFMAVLTLPPDELLLEKLAAYRDRRFIRDIYDVFHLLNYLEGEGASKKAAEFLSSPQEPVDGKNLKAIVYSGAVPTFEHMLMAIRRRFS